MSKSQPQKPAGKASQGKNEGEDLTTILEPSQRSDLTLLIANCTEAMRKVLLNNFDATAGLDKSFLREGMTEDEKMMAADPAKDDVSKYEREQKLKQEYEKDLATLKMKNLKKNAIKSYDEWREQVIMRVGKVVNSQDTAKTQLTKESSASEPKPQAPTTVGTITDVPNQKSALRFKDLYPPTKTPLTKLPMDRRTLVLHSVLLLLLSLEHYNAHSRVLMLNLTSSLKLPLRTFEQDEYTTAKGLLEVAKEMTADEETKKAAEENKETRKFRVNMATAAGAAVLGIAGGFAAPLVAAGVGSVMGGLGLGATAAAGYLGSVAGSTLLVGSLFGAYGGRMTGQMMDRYAREVEDFQFLPVHSNQKTSEDQTEGAQQASDHDHKLRVTICISGWLTEKEEVIKPWRVLGTGAEVFALKYELEALLNLGNAMNGMVQSAAWGYAQKELISRTIFADLASAFWPIGLLQVSRVLDNPFSVAKGRAEKAGEVLADALINRAQGERPVTLIGYSLGARVIYTCLMSLAKRKAFGLIENAVLIGAPTPSDTSDWRVLRTVVSGRLINVYSQNDYILGFMYRTSSIQYGVAGLQKIEGLASVENVDVSEDVDGHLRYRFLVGSILKKIGFEDINMDAVEDERKALEKMIKEEKKQSLQAQRKRLLRRESYKGKVNEAEEAEHEASEMERNVKSATQKSLVTRAIEYFYAPSVPNEKNVQKFSDNLQRVAQNPSEVSGVVSDTAKDIHATTEPYTTWAYKKLPSMPYMSKSNPASGAQKATGDPSKATGDATKTVSGVTKSGQSYTSQAKGYLPSMPSMPSFSKSEPKKGSQPAQAAKKAADAGQTGVKTAAGVTTDLLKPAIDNTLNPKNNPAVKAAKNTAKNAPIIHQAGDKVPGANKATDTVSSTMGNTTQNTTSAISGALNTVSSKVTDAGSGAASKVTETVPGAASKASGAASGAASQVTGSSKPEVDKGGAKDGGAKSYSSRAAGYLPGLPSMPSMPKWSGSKKKPPKLEKRDSGIKAAPPPKPELKPIDSGVQFPPPKLGSRTPSGVKSPPKLDRMPSGMKSPPAKLERLPSGMKSPPPKPERLPSGMKNPPAKLERLPSGMRSPPAKLERLPSGLKSPLSQVPSGMKSPPVEAAKVLSQAPAKAAKAGGDAAGKASTAGQQAAKTGADAAGKAVQTGQDAVKQGGGYLSGAGSAVASRLPGWGK